MSLVVLLCGLVVRTGYSTFQVLGHVYLMLILQQCFLTQIP